MEIFIGSSRESIDLVREVEVWLEEQGHKPLPWDKPGLFMPGDHTFNTLISISRRVEGAIFIFGEDDEVWYRSDAAKQPRDNVLIEYGLFAGALGPKKSIICRDGNPKHAIDLLGITYIDITESRRARAKLEISIWSRHLDSNPQDPELIRLQAKIAELEREKDKLTEKLSFESDKSNDLGKLLTKQSIVDFNNYDLNKDGHWKLLFEYNYFNNIAAYLSKSVASPIEFRNLLESNQAAEVSNRLSWYSPSKAFLGSPGEDRNPERNITFSRKALRIFRFYVEPETYRHFIDSISKPMQLAIEQIGQSSIVELGINKSKE